MPSPPVLENLMSIYDWVVVFGYLAVVLWVGLRFMWRQTSTDHYFTADRKIPGWAAGISMFATLLSSFTFIAFPGWTFDRDWQLLMREAMAPLAVVFVAILIIPIYREAIRMSAYEYLEKRFGYIGRIYGTIGFLVGHLFKTGVVLFALALALEAVVGVDKNVIILVLGATAVALTFVGGIEGVVWTEVVQGALMLVSGLVIIGFLLLLTEVPAAAMGTAWEAGKFRVIDPTPDLTRETVWVFASVGIFHFLTRYATDQTMVQRYLLAPSIRQAVQGTLIGLGCCMAAWLMFFLIGSLLWGFYQLEPHRLGEGITKGDQMLPYFIGRELPAGLTGLVIAGLLASAQSTISGDLNCVGACLTSDVYGRLRPNASTRAQLWIAKLTVSVSGILMVGLALAMGLYKGGIVEFTMDVSAFVGALFAGGLLALFLLGFFTRTVSKPAVYLGLASSAAVTVAALILQEDNVVRLAPTVAFHKWLLPIFTNILTVIVAYLAARTVFRRAAPAPENLTVFGHMASLPILGQRLRKRRRIPTGEQA